MPARMAAVMVRTVLEEVAGEERRGTPSVAVETAGTVLATVAATTAEVMVTKVAPQGLDETVAALVTTVAVEVRVAAALISVAVAAVVASTGFPDEVRVVATVAARAAVRAVAGVTVAVAVVVVAVAVVVVRARATKGEAATAAVCQAVEAHEPVVLVA